MNLFIFSYDIEMAAASVNPQNPFYKIKINQSTTRNNGSPITYVAENRNSLKQAMNRLDQELEPQLLRNEQIVEAEPGIYTWIIKNGILYAARIFTQQEIGTLHLDLDRQTSIGKSDYKQNIFSAGELKVSSSQGKPVIHFNLQSGTYTAKFNGFQKKADLELLFSMPHSSLFHDIQQDAWDMIDVMKKKLTADQKKDHPIIKKSEDTFTEDEISELLGKRVIKDIDPFKNRIKNRIILYKRDRMVERVQMMMCRFFPKRDCADAVRFRKGGSDSRFIEKNDPGHDFEVTAGRSFIIHEPIITKSHHISLLNSHFKRGNKK
jgi:hypothetical protein